MSKNWSWTGAGSSKDQKFACSDNPYKIFGTKWSNPVKLDRQRKFGYLFAKFKFLKED